MHSVSPSARVDALPTRYTREIVGLAPGAECPVPTLFRLLLVIGLLVALVWGAMLAMVTFMQPRPHAITRDVPLPGTAK